jgi:hypothetical protein
VADDIQDGEVQQDIEANGKKFVCRKLAFDGKV